MKLLVITCYTGGQDHADMTETMLRDLCVSIERTGASFGTDFHISVLAQETSAKWPPIVEERKAITFEESRENKGFAAGMNLALENGDKDYPDWTALLCINNDIFMPHKGWFSEMLMAYDKARIICPMTNFTGVNEQRSKAPQNKPYFDHVTTPAVCWLIPREVVKVIQADLKKGRLFPDDLGGRAWGEDVYVAALVRTKVAPRPFRIVPKAWIHHIGGQTSEKIPAGERLKAGGEARRRAKQKGFR